MVEYWDPPAPVRRELAGGQQLRALRDAAGYTLLELATRITDHGGAIGAAHINRIESGRIKHPDVATLDGILTHGLDASFRRRRDVLDAFGYRLPWDLPTEREIEEGRRLSAHELRSATWPAYMMDIGQRVWAWNRYVPRLLGLEPDDPAPARFVGLTVLDLVFNPLVGTNLMIANPERFHPLFLRMFRVQTLAHAHEPWFHDLIARASSWPGFADLWAVMPTTADEALDDQPIHPVAFSVPGVAEPLQFRIILIYLSLDPRIQVVHWIPYGAAAFRHCALWAEADGEP